MSRSISSVSTARSVVIWASFLLAMAGWSLAGWAWWYFGVGAGVRPSFIVGLTVGCTFTITCCHSIVMPDKVKLFGLGVAKGIELARTVQGHDPEPARRLTAVR